MNNWFDDLYQQALITFPNMPRSFVENAILRTVSRFFRETELLKDDAYIDADCGVHDFIVEVPDGRTIVQAKAFRSIRDTGKSPLVSSMWRNIPPADARFGYGYWVDFSGMRPTVDVSSTFRLKTGQYCLTYSWTPTGKDCDIPHHFVGKYFDTLVHGVLGALYLIPMDNDSQSAPLAKYNITEFERGMRNATVEETQNHTNRPLYMSGADFL